MRNIFLLAVVASSITLGQSPQAVESPELQAAQKPVELWMGRQLVLYEDASALPAGATRITPSEARITGDSIAVSMSQIRAFQSSQELAEFLAHAAAHARLGHAERMATIAEARARAEMEKEAEPVAAEFMESAGCAPAGSCGMFGVLLRAARRP